jgi:hypothetical protein
LKNAIKKKRNQKKLYQQQEDRHQGKETKKEPL